ncbi:MFS transporter [Bowmanella sp. JS7-9]|uniref:MFS transporter n=1 Tax=Pseudobowmanella zhangzhouensis TaxID=1537679 RepID=A0ABW1XML9_9ALTE|nr:MFS transporter [Bowmanella sp. JS7-9]
MSDKSLLRANLIGLALVYFLYFAQLGVMTPYLGVFLDGRGFSSVQIGELLAMITLTRIVGPNLWAAIADKTGHYLPIVRGGSLLAVLSFTLMLLDNDYWGIAAALGLVMMFWTAILPQLEVITMTCVASDSGRYSRIRLWGSIGYIVFAVGVGYLLDVFSADIVVTVSVVILSGLFLSTLAIRAPDLRSDKQAGGDIWPKLRHPLFLTFLASAFLLQLSFGPFYGFFALYMLELDYSGQQTGWLIALGVIAEVLLFLKAGRIIARFGVRLVLLACSLLAALRWYLTAWHGDNIIWLVVAQLTHAATFGLAHATSVNFLHHYFGPRYQSRGQALYVSLAFGGGGAIGNLVAGHLWQDGAGATLTFSLAAVAGLLSAACVALMPRSGSARAI